MTKASSLVVGGDGLIGSALVAALARLGHRVRATTRRAEGLPAGALFLDLSDDPSRWCPPESVDTAFLLASACSLAACEQDPAGTAKVNVDGTVAVASRLVERGVFVLFVSSNLVFSGQKPFASPNDPVSPSTEYGRQKAEAERRLLALGERVAVVRFSKIVGAEMTLFESWRKALLRGESFRAFSDKLLSPVPLALALDVLIRVGTTKLSGITQVSGADELSYFQFAREMALGLGASPELVRPVDGRSHAEAFGEGKPSPRVHCTLDSGRLSRGLGLDPPPIRESVDAVLGRDACCCCGGRSRAELSRFSELPRVTSDCRPWPAGGHLFVCTDCGAVQKRADADWKRDAAAIYASYAIYHQGGGAEQLVFAAGSGVSSSRSSRILERLSSVVALPKTGRLLDVGCGNGSLLRAAGERLPGWCLSGAELSEQHRGLVEQIPGVEAFYTGAPEAIRGRFDVITLVHVLEHVDHPRAMLETLAERLESQGLLLIQVPYAPANPFDLLSADHRTHFSTRTLRALVESAGLEVVHEERGGWVPKELSIVARKTDADTIRGRTETAPSESWAPEAVRWLDCVLETVEATARTSPFGLFGTSIAATWLGGVLGSRVSFFVDEDENRIGRSHLGRPIFHPRDVPPDGRVFMALAPEQAGPVRRRLEESGTRFSCVLPPPFEGRVSTDGTTRPNTLERRLG